MDQGWDIPQSRSGAGNVVQETFYWGSEGWNPGNKNDYAWDNLNMHEIFGMSNEVILQDDDVFATHENSTFATDLRSCEIMNTKVSLTFDTSSNVTWFQFEGHVKDWEEITVIEPKKRGPLLRNRLQGFPATFKRIFDREKLTQEDGVQYFMKTLKVKIYL